MILEILIAASYLAAKGYVVTPAAVKAAIIAEEVAKAKTILAIQKAMMVQSVSGQSTLATNKIIAGGSPPSKAALAAKGQMIVPPGLSEVAATKASLATNPTITSNFAVPTAAAAQANSAGVANLPLAASTANGGAAACGTNVLQTIAEKVLPAVGGAAGGGVVAQQVEKRRQEQDKKGLKEKLAQAKEQLKEAVPLQKELVAAQAQISQLQTDISTKVGEANQALAEAAKVAVETAKAATEATKAATEATKAASSLAVSPKETKTTTKTDAVVEASEATYPEAPASALGEVSTSQVTQEAPLQEHEEDDLKQIKGIGRVFEGRLNEAGIWTFADLASTEPQQIRKTVSSGKFENIIEPENWIAQARKLGNLEPEAATSENEAIPAAAEEVIQEAAVEEEATQEAVVEEEATQEAAVEEEATQEAAVEEEATSETAVEEVTQELPVEAEVTQEPPVEEERTAEAEAAVEEEVTLEANVAQKEAPAKEHEQDNLKRIKGIGRVFEGRLNEAGIWTFADLANAEPDEIRESVSSGKVENMIDPEEWIAQAERFADKG